MCHGDIFVAIWGGDHRDKDPLSMDHCFPWRPLCREKETHEQLHFQEEWKEEVVSESEETKVGNFASDDERPEMITDRERER